MNTVDCASCASAPSCKLARVGHICRDYSVVCSHIAVARGLALHLLGPAAFFGALREAKETTMVVKQQEHEYVTAIKAMVANQDIPAIQSLRDNEWSVTYLIIAASHISGDAKAVGARIANIPANARRGAVVDILVEVASAQHAVAAEAPVPFDDAQPVAVEQPVVVADEQPAPRARRRRVSEALAAPTPAEMPAEQPGLSVPETLRVLDFDRAFGDVLGAIAQLSEEVKREQGATEQAIDARTAQLADAMGAIHARVDTLGYNLALFRNAMAAFEQELAINGVISNAVFTEATADWRD